MFSIVQRVAGLVFVFSLLTPVYAVGTLSYDLKVKRAPISSALVEFSRQTGISLSVPQISFRDGKTRYLNGKYTSQQGLALLLRGTDFTFKRVTENSFRIIRKPRIRPFVVNATLPVESATVSVQEIMVSALRRSVALQKMPYSISVMSNSRRQQLRATSTYDVVHQIASMYATKQGAGQNKIVIRGLSDGAFAGRAQSLVSSYMDYARLTYNAPDPALKLIDIDRIEVLRGPQGTLYGSGALTGLYRMVTHKPDPSNTEVKVTSSYAITKNGDAQKAFSTILNIPLLEDQLALRVVAYTDHNGGYIDDELLALENVNSNKRIGGRAALLYRANDALTLTVGANFQDFEADDSDYYDGARKRLKRGNFIQEPRSDSFQRYFVTFDGDFSWGNLTSTGSYMQRDISKTLDGSAVLPTLFLLPQAEATYTDIRSIKTFSNEIHLSSKTGSQLEWLIGGFYSSRSENIETDLTVPDLSNVNFIETDKVYLELLDDTLTEYAVFGEATYYLNEKISVTGGLRWFNYKNKASSAISEIGFPLVNFADGVQNKSGVTPKLVVSYHHDDNTLFYAQFSEGYRVGGLNFSGPTAVDILATASAASSTSTNPEGEDFAISPSGAAVNFTTELANFASDRLSNFEIGIKKQTFDYKLTVNAAAFYATWKDIQALEFKFNGLPEIANVGDAQIWGAELDFTFQPNHAFEIGGSISFTRSEITRSNFSFGADKGSPLPSSPDFSASIFTLYDFDLGSDLMASISADQVFVGSANLLFDTVSSPKTDSYFLSNFRFSVRKSRWQLTVFANNVFDSQANSFAFGNPFSLAGLNDVIGRAPTLPTSDGFTVHGISNSDSKLVSQITPHRPRTFGVELGWTF